MLKLARERRASGERGRASELAGVLSLRRAGVHECLSLSLSLSETLERERRKQERVSEQRKISHSSLLFLFALSPLVLSRGKLTPASRCRDRARHGTHAHALPSRRPCLSVEEKRKEEGKEKRKRQHLKSVRRRRQTFDDSPSSLRKKASASFSLFPLEPFSLRDGTSEREKHLSSL